LFVLLTHHFRDHSDGALRCTMRPRRPFLATIGTPNIIWTRSSTFASGKPGTVTTTGGTASRPCARCPSRLAPGLRGAHHRRPALGGGPDARPHERGEQLRRHAAGHGPADRLCRRNDLRAGRQNEPAGPASIQLQRPERRGQPVAQRRPAASGAARPPAAERGRADERPASGRRRPAR
jgi:hypothetical protein